MQVFRLFLKSLMLNNVRHSIGSAFQTNGAALLYALPDSTVLLKGAVSKELFDDLSDLLMQETTVVIWCTIAKSLECNDRFVFRRRYCDQSEIRHLCSKVLAGGSSGS